MSDKPSGVLGAALLLVALAGGATPPEPPNASVTVGPIERDVRDGRPGLARFTVEVLEGGKAAPQRFVVSAPDKMLGSRERPTTYLVGSRLVVLTEAIIAVFDRLANQQVLDVVASPGVAATDDGRHLAYEALQRPFTSPEASGSVVVVVDVTTLERQAVFPEREAVRAEPSGRFSVWEEDTAQRHAVELLAFSADGKRLAFLCRHGDLADPGGPRQEYVGIVDLSRGLAASSFVHLPFDWRKHLKAGVELQGRQPFFAADSLRWSSEQTLVIRSSSGAWWLEPEITFAVGGEGQRP